METASDHSSGGGVATSGRSAALIDEIRRHEKTVGADQARRAQLMLTFADTRRRLDQQRISIREAAGGDARYTAGEFAVTELSLAVAGSKHHIQRTTAMARRLQAEAPDVWDCWSVGDIDQDKAIRINRALRRLVRDDSKKLLNQLVVKIAPLKTPELLGRWLNQFIAQVEPDETDERLRRSFEDRYVSIRPDIDGISFLHAALSCVDASAIDQLLSALAAAADPGDTRTHAQRRADALVDILCGRVSNGCHVRWDTNSDADDHLDDPDPAENANRSDDVDPRRARDGRVDADEPGGGDKPTGPADTNLHGQPDSGPGIINTGGDTHPSASADRGSGTSGGGQDCRNTNPGTAIPGSYDSDDDVDCNNPGSDGDDWSESDWDQPATTFRPAPAPSGVETTTDHGTGTGTGKDATDADLGSADADPGSADADLGSATAEQDAAATEQCSAAVDQDTGTVERPPDQQQAFPDGRTGNHQPARTPPGNWVITPCPGDHQPNPLPVHIGIVITAASLFGHSNTPGQLEDRSSLIAAVHARRLAAQPGTLFHRLITDDAGNLLQVTELGRFPSRKLGIAIDYRDGTCTNPTCHTPTHRCDHDHVIPHPEGPTTGINLNNDCRPEHRAKTHGGHQTSRPTPHTTTWTTPTGHTYTATDPPLPVEPLPDEQPFEPTADP